MVLKKLIFLFFLLLCYRSINAQADSAQQGRIIIHGDEKIKKLADYRKQWFDSTNAIPGFRIQILSESGAKSKTLALEEKARFMLTYPQIPVYLISQMPYFKLRVGDFKDRLHALKFHEEIKNIYPHSFIVPDEISIK